MNYAIFKMNKLKTSKALTDSYRHNERLYNVRNADPTKRQDNVEMIDTFGRTYEDMFNDTIAEMKAKGVPERTIRKDAVLGFEVVLTFSREQTGNIDVEEWAKANLEWLDEHFNPPGHQVKFIDRETGQEKTAEVQNIKHMVLHLDETKPHIHAFIVPIDEKGNLNSKYYNQGREYLTALQTDYARAMSEFSLIRGAEHSVATPQQMSRYYNFLKQAVEAELPEPKEGETIDEYRRRAEETYRCALSNHRDEMVKKEQEIIQLKSDVRKQVKETEGKYISEHEFYCRVEDAMGYPGEITPQQLMELAQATKDMLAFKKALENYPDETIAASAADMFRLLTEWQLAKDAEEARKRREEEERAAQGDRN